MHQDAIYTGVTDNTRQVGIRFKGRHVVYDCGAKFDACGGDSRAPGINRQRKPYFRLTDGEHGRYDAAELLGLVHRFGTGTRGLAAYVDYVCALFRELQGAHRRRFRRYALSAVRERVGRYVQYRHYGRRRQV